jgi:hypothetical protein
MTEQLMDDLTNEEHEALLLMSEHGIAAPLSPAAQAVLDAFTEDNSVYDWKHNHYNTEALAAALRAAADQAVPLREAPRIRYDAKRPTIEWHIWNAYQQSRSRLLAIAAELEAL